MKHAPKIDLLDRALSVIFYAAYFAVLAGYDLLQRLALFAFGRRGHDAVVAALNADALSLFGLIGGRVRVLGEVPAVADRPYVIVANHQSLHDIPILYNVFAALRPRYIAKQELARFLPSISFNLRHGLSGLIDRKNAEQALTEIKRVGRHMREYGFSTVIFPEGTRAREGALKKFRSLGVTTLLDAVPDAEIIPVALENSWKLMAHGLLVPRGIQVTVAVGPVLRRGDFSSQRELVRAAENWIREALERIRAESQ